MHAPHRPFCRRIAAFVLAGGLSFFSFPSWAVDLPAKAPVPEARDAKAAAEAQKEEAEKKAEENETPEPLPDKAPLPEKRPAEARPAEEAPHADETGKADADGEKSILPADDKDGGTSAAEPGKDDKTVEPEAAEPTKAEPEATKTSPGEDDEDGAEEGVTETKIPPPLSEEGKQCRENLSYLGVAFTESDTVDTEEGCAIPHPLTITTLAKDISIEPKAEMNCMMAQTLADFMQDVVQPAAERHFNQAVKALRHASAFVCRPRNGTKILSEHAFGNALDIAAFVLADGTSVEVKAYDPEDHASLDKAQFLNEVRAAACGPFTTVLGPGSNADHATHFHLDLRGRNSRYKVCE